MSELESQFRSIMEPGIRGGPIELDEAQEGIVALWSVKTWFLLVRAWGYLKVSPLAVGSADYRLLYEERNPPPWFQVWVGRVLPDDDTVVWLSNQLVQTSGGRPVGLVGVMLIGSVLFHIYGPFPRTKDDEIQVSAMAIRTGLRRLLRPVFPHSDDLADWDPGLGMPTTELEKFWPSGRHIEPVPANSETSTGEPDGL
jgi:hypothetical protein